MSESPRTAGEDAFPDESFVAQLLGYLDGTAGPQDMSELKEALAARASLRRLFVEMLRLHGSLTGLLAPLRVTPSSSAFAPEAAPAPPPAPRPPEAEDTNDYVEDEGGDTRY